MRAKRNPSPYNAPRRAEQAAATRAAIIDAAGQLFAERGYAGTTMAAIATEARVATKSVYALADKPSLLLLSLDRAIAGNDEPIGLIDQRQLQAALGAADPSERVRLLASFGAAALLRLYPLYRAFEHAAAAEPDLRQRWDEYQRIRRDDVARVVAVLARSPLRAGLTEERAVDTIWALLTWHPVALLVEERGWTDAELEEWLHDVLATLLLPPTRRRR